MNLKELWSHCIDGWVTIQKSPTVLTINPDSGYVLRSAPLITRIRVQKGNFPGHLQALGASSGMLVEQLLVSEGLDFPSLSSHLSHLNLLFGWSYQDPMDNLSWGGQDYHIWNNFNFSSDTAQLYWQNGWYSWLADLFHQSHSRFLGLLHLKSQPLLALHLSSLQFQCFPVWQIKPWRYNCPSAS